MCDDGLAEGSGDLMSECSAATDELIRNTPCESFVVNATVTDADAVCGENCKNLINLLTESCPNMVSV